MYEKYVEFPYSFRTIWRRYRIPLILVVIFVFFLLSDKNFSVFLSFKTEDICSMSCLSDAASQHLLGVD